MTNQKHILITLGVSLLLILGLIYYTDVRQQEPALLTDAETGEILSIDGPLTQEEQLVNSADISNNMNPLVTLNTTKGPITIELFTDQMPITTGNFLQLAQSGFYDGTKFHRVIDGFMIQGGDPNTKTDNEATYGTGGSDNIQDEFVDGELLTNTRGTIAMANTGQPNSGSSQFFINLGDNSPLDFDDNRQPMSKHPVFGRVVEGMDVVDAIAKVETKERDIPVVPVVIESVTVATPTEEVAE